MVFTILTGCGYIGDPQPPALNIPKKIEDLVAVQRGAKIYMEFTAPTLTTENLVIRKRGQFDLRAGAGWPNQAAKVPVTVDEHGRGHAELPVAGITGKDITIGVRTLSPSGRPGAWSNLISMAVVEPVPPATDVAATSVAQGVKVTWQGAQGPFTYRIFRRADKEENPTEIGRSDKPEYIDTTTQYLHKYSYMVQTLRKAGASEAQSDIPQSASVAPIDKFAPAAPVGLTLLPGLKGIELAWERNTEPDLKGYHIYRALDNGVPERIAEIETPAYSDHAVETGKRYRYWLTAFDLNNNESEKSTPAEITAP